MKLYTKNAFTFVELIVVMAIIFVLFFMTLSTFDEYNENTGAITSKI